MLLGYIPTLTVAISVVVVMIHQAFYSRGCMDGFELVMVAFAGFAVGGMLNIGFLLCYWPHQASWCEFPERWKALVAKGSMFCAKATLVLTAIGVLRALTPMLGG